MCTREIPSSVRSLAARWLVVAGGAAASACIGPDVDPEVNADTGSTHALITIDHRVTREGDGESSGNTEVQAAALAGFARIPSGVDSEAVLALAGWTLELPEPGACLELSTDRDRDTPLAPIERIELLEVGNVSIEAGADETRLAPRAFTGGDVLTGVLYTTRDPSAEPLPPGEPYTIRTSGGALPALEFSGQAPDAPGEVTVGGIPLGALRAVSLNAPIDLTWNVGVAGDILYVDLASADGMKTTRCAFRDEDGAGTVPLGAFTGTGEGSLSIHRLRALPVEGDGLQGELRFEVEQLVGVTFQG